MTTSVTSSPSFFTQLQEQTAADQQGLLAIPFVQAAVAGRLTRSEYLAFLGQAYHHVRHTVPLLMATGARLGPERPGLQAALAEYIAEERGHEQWILNDIEAAGGDARAVARGQPELPCEVLVAYAYDQVTRRDPLGFFGMVHVLEGTSVRAATQAAQALGESLQLPPSAFSYLSSHGSLDQDHVAFFGQLVDGLPDPAEQQVILRAARAFYRLYGDIFRSLSPRQAPRSVETR